MPKANGRSKTERLTALREQAKIGQREVAEYFGLKGARSRYSVSAWESGTSIPRVGLRSTFISYLWEKLNLKQNPEEMWRLWRDVMTGVWKWEPLKKHELPKELPHQIPAPTPDFTGREDTINTLASQIRSAVSENKAALYAVWGMGGVGKTELAYTVAREIADLFPDGQLLIELRGEGTQSHERALSPVQALKSIIRTLTYDDDIPDAEDELIARYRTVLSHRRVLIVADNARDAEQVRPFIPPIGSALLITSRMLINLKGLKTIALDVLDDAASEALLLEICPRIGTNAPELASLCGYLPLALRISASLLDATPMLPVAVFLEQLRKERLVYLTDPEGNPNDPQASVEASLQISFDALEPDMQNLMAQLSVFPASFRAESAAAIVQGIDSVEEKLEKLYRRSMVEWQESLAGYALHDLVRHFCEKQLVDIRSLHYSYISHYSSIAKSAVIHFMNKDKSTGVVLFDQERAHLEKGLALANIYLSQTDNEGMDFDEIILGYIMSVIYIDGPRYYNQEERISYLDEAINIIYKRNDKPSEVVCTIILNKFYVNAGIPKRAIELLQGVHEFCRNNMADEYEVYLLCELGDAYLHMNQVETSLNYYQEALDLSREINDTHQEAYVLIKIGDIYNNSDETSKAYKFFLQALDIIEENKDLSNEAAVLYTLGNIAREENEIQHATVFYQEALRITLEIKDRDMETTILWNWSLLKEKQGELALAIEMMQLAVDYEEELKDPAAIEHRDEITQLRHRLAQEQDEQG